jgi:hypothetical protein
MMLLTAALWISTTLFGAVVEGERTGDVRVVPMKSTPQPDEVELVFSYPHEGEVKTESPVMLQMRLEAYPIGFYSDFPRGREIRNSEQGQSVHIILDNKPYLSINEAIDDISENEEIDFDQTLEIKIPYKLSEGMHILRAFPVRSYGECLKGPKCFTAIYFYYGKEVPNKSYDLSKPYLTYNQPEGEYKGDQPILLDFYLTNAQLSQDGYKVRLTIDGSDKRILTDWVPYYIYGLKKGSHTFKIDLLDPQGKTVAPLFDDLSRTIVVR